MSSGIRPFHIPFNRRRLLKSMAVASAGWTLPGYLAEALTFAASVTQGPYYPLADDIPLDKDNDLVQLNNNLTLAGGVITHLSGRILDASGNPVRNALVELWHADREGDYSYSTGVGRNAACDANFAGFGQCLTSASGAYRFRTIKAGLYVGRTRHYHLACTFPGRTTRFCTQTGWNETAIGLTGTAWATQNSNDNVFSTITNAAQKAAVLLDYTTVAGGVAGEVAGTFDFALNFTPVEPTYPEAGGFLAAGEVVTGPSSAPRYKLTIPAYANYCYEIYSNPTLADMEWKALPFSLTQTGALDRHKHIATAGGSLGFYVEAPAGRGFYKVSFRPPGANTGTP
jgi:protocatechuate 3,4-dioxygenase beta subunit